MESETGTAHVGYWSSRVTDEHEPTSIQQSMDVPVCIVLQAYAKSNELMIAASATDSVSGAFNNCITHEATAFSDSSRVTWPCFGHFRTSQPENKKKIIVISHNR